MSATLSEPRCADNPAAAIFRELAAPFPVDEVQFKPQVVKGSRALAIAYIDARAVMDRLDAVVGVHNWQDRYLLLPDNAIQCRLRVRIHGEWVAKADVGSPSDQPDGGDRLKAAFSDALKRAAVKFGIGRYLYRLPAQWVDYDPQRRQFVKQPMLPAFALPKQAAPILKGAAPTPRKLVAHARPANGAELQRRLYEYDTRLATEGLCSRGDLVRHVVAAGAQAGYDADLATWTNAAIDLAVEATKRFEEQARQARAGQKEVA